MIKHFISFFIFLCTNSNAQQSIKLENVRDHVGDSVKLKALIYGGKYLQNVKGSPTFLNVGGQYPNEQLTLVIWNNTRSEFKQAPEDIYDHKMAWITGKVILYKERP